MRGPCWPVRGERASGSILPFGDPSVALTVLATMTFGAALPQDDGVAPALSAPTPR
ncbi:MAG: hypothetical protein ABR524_13345 [Thermoanaerobaculia bacterium]